MRVRLLGTGSADGWPNPFCACGSCTAERRAGRSRQPSSALVDDVVLIDCGPTTPHLPAGSAVTLVHVEHVLITHGHPDHLHPAFLLTRRWTSPDRVLHVWGPALAIAMCRDWIGPGSAVELHAVTPGDHLELASGRGPFAVDVLAARHAHGDGDVIAEEAVLYAVTAPDGARLLYATDTGPFAPTEAGVPSAPPFDVVLLDETFGEHHGHGTGHLDLTTLPAMLRALREHGAVTDDTVVAATHLSHHNPPSVHLRGRLAALGVVLPEDMDVIDTDAGTASGRGGRTTLVLGGARSGKSHHAEAMLAGCPEVTYVATGGAHPDDAEWADRVRRHRERRPSHWTTVETTDVADLLRAAPAGAAVLVDCVSLWLTAQLDAADAWRRLESGDQAALHSEIEERIDDLASSIAASRADIVLVSNEVGMGVVPATASGRAFRDLLGIANVRLAQACDETVLVVAGRALTLDGSSHAR